jgi:hypothetical protein
VNLPLLGTIQQTKVTKYIIRLHVRLGTLLTLMAWSPSHSPPHSAPLASSSSALAATSSLQPVAQPRCSSILAIFGCPWGGPSQVAVIQPLVFRGEIPRPGSPVQCLTGAFLCRGGQGGGCSGRGPQRQGPPGSGSVA